MSNSLHYDPKFISDIIRIHFEEQLSVDEICERYQLEPEILEKWKKELYEGAILIFSKNDLYGDEAEKDELLIKKLQNNLKRKEKIANNLRFDNDELKGLINIINDESGL
jgi:transposase-like protein